MKTSSDHRTPSPEPHGDHWLELTATLSAESKQVFADWLDKQLEAMLADLEAFVTPDSLRKSLRR